MIKEIFVYNYFRFFLGVRFCFVKLDVFLVLNCCISFMLLINWWIDEDLFVLIEIRDLQMKIQMLGDRGEMVFGKMGGVGIDGCL